MSESLALSPWHALLLRICRSRATGWWGRRAALAIRHYLMPRLQTPFVATVGGITLDFHLGDNVSERRFFFMPNFFDPAEFALIAAHLPSHGVFVDIGANVGIYSLRAAHCLGPDGRVIAYEPNPVVARRFEANLRLNRIEASVRLIAEGVADATATFPLYLDPTNLGGASLVATARAKRIDVPCRALRESLRALDVPRIDILKIDVEGAEPLELGPFFQAAPPALWPRWLIMERSDPIWDADFLPGLLARGYAIHETTRANYILAREG